MQDVRQILPVPNREVLNLDRPITWPALFRDDTLGGLLSRGIDVYLLAIVSQSA